MQGETVDERPFPFVRRVGDVAVISCSSAVPSPPWMAIGKFEADQAARLARCLKLLGDGGYFRVVLIHHPPNQEQAHPRLGLYGAKLFRKVIAEHGAELILHGHTHKSSIYAIPGPHGDVPVIGVAAASAAQGASDGHDPARYNLFNIQRLRHGLAVHAARIWLPAPLDRYSAAPESQDLLSVSDAFIIEEPAFDPATGIASFGYGLGELHFTEVLTFPFGADAAAAADAGLPQAPPPHRRRPRRQLLQAARPDPDQHRLPAHHARARLHPRRLRERARRVLRPQQPQALRPDPDRGRRRHRPGPAASTLSNRALLPIGGGKDLLVSVQLLEAADLDFTPFAVNAKGPILGSVDKIGRPPLYIKRTLDAEMIRLGKEPGYYNGHVPSTAINSMIAALTALLFSYNRIVLSNERFGLRGQCRVRWPRGQPPAFQVDRLRKADRRCPRAGRPAVAWATSRCYGPTPRRRSRGYSPGSSASTTCSRPATRTSSWPATPVRSGAANARSATSSS